MKFGWPRLFSISFQAICFAGFSFQAINFTREYFEYATESDLAVQTPVEIPVPDFTICFRYVDILDFEALKVKYPNFTAKPIEQLTVNDEIEEAILRIQKSVTVEDILTFSPPSESIITKCSTKGPKDFEFEDIEMAECNKQFAIWKFYLQEYACYRFKKITSMETKEYQYRLVSYAIERPGTLYTLKTNNKKLAQTRYMKTVIHSSVRNPEASLAMMTNIKRRFDDENRAEKDDVRKNYYIFQLTYSSLQMIRKEPPYDTGCRYYNLSSDFQAAVECRTECLINRTVHAFAKVPFSAALWNWTSIIRYVTEHGDTSEATEALLQDYSAKEEMRMQVLRYRHLTTDDLRNQSTASTLMQIENDCLYLCRQPDCEDEVTLTKGSYDYIREEDLKDEDGQFLEFEISVPKKPLILITYKEKVSWSEFLVYLLSCFGIWFGLSVLSVNPFTMKINGLVRKTGVKEFCIQMRVTTRKRIREEVEAITRQIIAKRFIPDL